MDLIIQIFLGKLILVAVVGVQQPTEEGYKVEGRGMALAMPDRVDWARIGDKLVNY